MAIDDLDLKHLRVFAAVAETQNFSHAAEICGLSQSTVSTIIQQLEQELGVRLIDRTTRRVALSALGEEFLPGVRRILSEFDRQIEAMRGLRALQGGQVHIACVPSVAMRLVPRVIGKFRDHHPRVAIKVLEVPRGRAMELVRSGGADLAIANEPPALADLSSQQIMQDEFALVLRRDHPLAARTRIGWQEAREAGLVMMAPETGIRLEIEHGLPPGLLQDKVGYEAVNPSTLLAMVAHGIGVAPLPGLAWPAAADPVLTVRPLDRPVVRRTLHLIWRADRSLTPAATAFHGHVAGEAQALSAEIAAFHPGAAGPGCGGATPSL